ncbi:MAG: transcriptional repressor [Kofleriaceae bacterium]
MASSPRSDAAAEALRAAVRAVGLRATPSRIAVLGLLRRTGAPISHGEAFEQLADRAWDRATIYRNLIDLAEAGLARRTDVGDHVWRFEATDGEHADAAGHPHFVCTECGVVECLPGAEVAFQRRAPRAVRQRQVEVQVRGRCDGCY